MSEYKKTVAVDLDGVLASYEYFKGSEIIDPPRPEAAELLKRLAAEYHVVVHTARDAPNVRAWLDAYKLSQYVSGINCCLINGRPGKPVAIAFIDDRAVPYHGDIERTIALVKALERSSLKKDISEENRPAETERPDYQVACSECSECLIAVYRHPEDDRARFLEFYGDAEILNQKELESSAEGTTADPRVKCHNCGHVFDFIN